MVARSRGCGIPAVDRRPGRNAAVPALTCRPPSFSPGGDPSKPGRPIGLERVPRALRAEDLDAVDTSIRQRTAAVRRTISCTRAREGEPRAPAPRTAGSSRRPRALRRLQDPRRCRRTSPCRSRRCSRTPRNAAPQKHPRRNPMGLEPDGSIFPRPECQSWRGEHRSVASGQTATRPGAFAGSR